MTMTDSDFLECQTETQKKKHNKNLYQGNMTTLLTNCLVAFVTQFFMWTISISFFVRCFFNVRRLYDLDLGWPAPALGQLCCAHKNAERKLAHTEPKS